jgi:hypothetical protein
VPFKPGPQQPDFSSLFTSLSNSRTQITNNALYQTIFFLIQNTNISRDQLVDAIDVIDQGLSDIGAASFLTVDDETNLFPNSRQLLAGLGIEFDDSVAGERTISAAVGNYYDAPLTDGNEDETDLIFASGECIIVQVPIPPLS